MHEVGWAFAVHNLFILRLIGSWTAPITGGVIYTLAKARIAISSFLLRGHFGSRPQLSNFSPSHLPKHLLWVKPLLANQLAKPLEDKSILSSHPLGAEHLASSTSFNLGSAVKQQLRISQCEIQAEGQDYAVRQKGTGVDRTIFVK